MTCPHRPHHSSIFFTSRWNVFTFKTIPPWEARLTHNTCVNRSNAEAAEVTLQAALMTLSGNQTGGWLRAEIENLTDVLHLSSECARPSLQRFLQLSVWCNQQIKSLHVSECVSECTPTRTHTHFVRQLVMQQLLFLFQILQSWIYSLFFLSFPPIYE